MENEMESSEISFAPCSLEEQETTINLDYAEKKAYVYTSRIGVAKKLIDMCAEHKDETFVQNINEYGLQIQVPLDWIVIRPKTKRNLSEEQRKKLAERLAANRVRSA